VIEGKAKILLFSISKFTDANGAENYVLLFRDLTDQRHFEKQASRNEKMVAMGELSSSVAHEIRNPLNSISTIAQQIGKDFEVKENQEEFKNLAGIVYKEVKRINETIETFLRFARPRPIKAEEFILGDFIAEIQKQYASHLTGRKIEFEIHSSFNGYVNWDARQMKQVFVNLMENAIDAQPDGGKIIIKTYQPDPDNIEITFADCGKGVLPEDLSRIFDLYFTTKEKGNGIGLSIVHKIITEHGGSISVNSKINSGTEFLIKLPQQFI
jgi:signal transduction histidine kinase